MSELVEFTVLNIRILTQVKSFFLIQFSSIFYNSHRQVCFAIFNATVGSGSMNCLEGKSLKKGKIPSTTTFLFGFVCKISTTSKCI